MLRGRRPLADRRSGGLLRRLQKPADAPAAAPAPAAPGDAPQLTAREHEVLTLIAKGFSFPEIADILGISAHTVTTHVRHIYRKLAVGTRGSAVYEAVNLGLIDLAE